MATLNINGRKVKVDDSFLSLSPQQQEATVNEIAASMGQAGGPAPDTPPVKFAPGAVAKKAVPEPRQPDDLSRGLNIATLGLYDPLKRVTDSLLGVDGGKSQRSENVEGLSPEDSYNFALSRIRAANPQATDEEWAQFVESKKPYGLKELLDSGLTLGLNDEAAGVAAGLVGLTKGRDFGQTFNNASDLERARQKYGAQKEGILGGVAQIGGSLLSGRPDVAGAKVVGMIPQAIEAGKASILPGFIQGFANNDGDLAERTRSGLIGGTIGAVVGGTVGAAGAKLGEKATGMAQSIANGNALKNAPVLEDVRAAATNLFNSSKASGMAFTPKKFMDFAANLVTKAKGKSIDPDLDGEALLIYRRMAELAQKGNQSGKGVTLAELHNLRQKAQDVALTAEKNRTKAFAQDVVDGLDELLTNPKATDVIGGPKAASDLLEGISLWNKAKKMSLIEEVITKAQYQKSGVENGLRLGFLGLLRNPKTRKLFTEAEIAELERVAHGTAGANILNLIGKFGFSKSGNGLGGFLGGVGAFAASGGNPFVTGAAALGATAARKGAEKLTQSAAERAVKAVAAANLPTVAPVLLPPGVAPALVTGGQSYGQNNLR